MFFLYKENFLEFVNRDHIVKTNSCPVQRDGTLVDLVTFNRRSNQTTTCQHWDNPSQRLEGLKKGCDCE